MKKRFFLFSILLLFFNPCLADDWSNFAEADRLWDNQKSITNKEFEDTINALEEKKNKKEKKKKQKMFKKISGGGTSLHNELNPEGEIVIQTPLDKKEDETIANIPVNLIIDEQILEKGYYKIIAEKDENNDVYLLFYQSRSFKGKIRASETKEDFDQENIDFAKLIPYNENFVKIIFGSLDINAYAYVRFMQEVNF